MPNDALARDDVQASHHRRLAAGRAWDSLGWMARLRRGDLLPRMVVPPPGPRSRELSRELARSEAPGINTLVAGEPAVVWEEARGTNVVDVDGNRYLDLTSGFGAAAVGHRHPRVVAAVRQQAGRLTHGLGDVAAHPARVELARRLVALAPGDDLQVYFAVSGADAVEIALKTALLVTGRPGVLAFDPAYHGSTLGALAVSGRDEFRRPFAAQLNPRVHRLPFACPPARIAELLDRETEIGALIVEPIVGREGVLLPPPGWLGRIAAVCREHGALFIADEILTGFGRTGSWFVVAQEKLEPDLLCCGKALGGGLPVAAVLGRRGLMAAWQTGGEALHTGTFVAHPLACAAALATLRVLEEEGLPARAARLGEGVARRLEGWPRRSPLVSQVRGRGLLWGVELISAAAAAAWTAAARERGLLLVAGGPEGRVAEIAPPLVVTERQLETALDLLEEALLALERTMGANPPRPPQVGALPGSESPHGK